MRFGAKVTWLVQGDDHVEVFVNDESAGVYDLLIGADGLNSTVRDIIGIETKPQPTGMGIWRAFVSRPAEVRAHRALLRRAGLHRRLHADG